MFIYWMSCSSCVLFTIFILQNGRSIDKKTNELSYHQIGCHCICNEYGMKFIFCYVSFMWVVYFIHILPFPIQIRIFSSVTMQKEISFLLGRSFFAGLTSTLFVHFELQAIDTFSRDGFVLVRTFKHVINWLFGRNCCWHIFPRKHMACFIRLI